MIADPTSQDALIASGFAQDETLSLAPVPAKPKRRSMRKSEKKWIQALTIRTEDGKRFRVPVNADSAKAERQLLAAKLMKAYSQNVDFVLNSNMVMEPKSLSDFMKAGEMVSNMVEAAHKGEEIPETSGGNSAIGKLAGQMLGAAAQGLIKGAEKSFEERMQLISKLGAKQQAKVVESNDRIRAQAAQAEIIVEPEAQQP